jgi:DNA processing protein
MTQDIHIAALCSIPVLGPVTIRRLLRAFGPAEAVFRAKARNLMAVEGINEKRAESITGFSGWEKLEKDIRDLKVRGAGLVFHGSPGYPGALGDLGEDSPLMLYIRGEAIKEDRFAIAIVGSRDASTYGRTTTEKVASELASMGLTVVSGLARGIDTAAHKGCLDAGGRSLGVLGSGIDVVYPPENRWLFEKTAASGAVISEFPPGTPPYQSNFHRRNRLISGLSMGVLVVEAASRSGSLITAKHALEQGKEVFSIPGNISSDTSKGTNELIKQGAKVVTRASDILEELAPQLKGFIKSEKRREAEVSVEEKALCDIMSAEPSHIDVISRQSGMAPAMALALLLGLELKGVVKQTEGKRFYLA